jgi:hypothetical protein
LKDVEQVAAGGFCGSWRRLAGFSLEGRAAVWAGTLLSESGYVHVDGHRVCMIDARNSDELYEALSIARQWRLRLHFTASALVVYPEIRRGVAALAPQVRSLVSGEMLLAEADSSRSLPAEASVLAVQGLYGLLVNGLSTYGKEKVYGSIP